MVPGRKCCIFLCRCTLDYGVYLGLQSTPKNVQYAHPMHQGQSIRKITDEQCVSDLNSILAINHETTLLSRVKRGHPLSQRHASSPVLETSLRSHLYPLWIPVHDQRVRANKSSGRWWTGLVLARPLDKCLYTVRTVVLIFARTPQTL